MCKDLSGKNFSGLDLSRIDFSDKILVEADFRNSILAIDNLKNVNIERAHLEETKVWFYKIDEEQHIRDIDFDDLINDVMAVGTSMVVGGVITYSYISYNFLFDGSFLSLVFLFGGVGLLGASTTYAIVIVGNKVLTRLRWMREMKRKRALQKQLRKTSCQFIFSD